MIRSLHATGLCCLLTGLLALALAFSVSAQVDPEPITVVPNTESLESERLLELLNAYQAAEAAHAASQSEVVVQDDQVVVLGGTPYDPDTVLLSGTQSITAVQTINDRLQRDSALTAPRREMDIIYHVEVRRDGKLISSGSHSLRTLGKSQFVGRVSLEGGQATLTVKTDNWSADLSPEAASDYIILFSAPYLRTPELHLVPVLELEQTNHTDLPEWLPYSPPNGDS